MNELLDIKPASYPKSGIKSKYDKKYFSLSRFLAKTLRVNKPAMKEFPKNLAFGVNVKL